MSRTKLKAADEETERDIRRTTLGRFIRANRTKAGVSQVELAEHLGYTSSQFVSNWERGHSTPPFDALPRIADFLGLDEREIVAAVEKYQLKKAALERRQLTALLRARRAR